MEPKRWEVHDRISGFDNFAVLRWRLEPNDWQLDGYECRGNDVSLGVEPPPETTRFELVQGWESRHYGVRTPLPVLELEVSAVRAPITIVTVIDLDTSQLRQDSDPQGDGE